MIAFFPVVACKYDNVGGRCMYSFDTWRISFQFWYPFYTPHNSILVFLWESGPYFSSPPTASNCDRREDGVPNNKIFHKIYIEMANSPDDYTLSKSSACLNYKIPFLLKI